MPVSTMTWPDAFWTGAALAPTVGGAGEKVEVEGEIQQKHGDL